MGILTYFVGSWFHWHKFLHCCPVLEGLDERYYIKGIQNVKLEDKLSVWKTFVTNLMFFSTKVLILCQYYLLCHYLVHLTSTSTVPGHTGTIMFLTIIFT